MDANRSPSVILLKKRSVLFAAALVPFITSLGFHLAGTTAREPQQGIDRPALVFDQYLVDRGPVPPEPNIMAFFAFRNRGTSTLKITDVEPSCGCLMSEFKDNKREYAPGEEGKFFLTVKTTRETPGQKDYYVKLRYEDPEPREIDVSFRFVLPEHRVQVRPTALIVYQPNTAPTSKEVLVTDNRPKPLRVLDVSTSADYVTARIGDLEEDEDGVRQTMIEVSVGTNVPPGKHKELVTLLTDDEKYQQIPIYLMVHGPAVEADIAGSSSEVRVEPELLVLNGSRTQSTEGEVVLIDERANPLYPTEIISTSPAVRAELGKQETDAAGHSRWQIRVSAVPGLPAGKFRSMLKILTEDPARPELAVPVHLVVPESEGTSDPYVVPASGTQPETR